MSVKSYRELKVWQKAMDLVVNCYQLTRTFPKCEIYGLTSQLQRAAVSIPANIAEGRSRRHSKELLHHISIAYGSLAEVETHIQVAERLNYINSDEVLRMLDETAEIGRMLNGLSRSIGRRS